MRAMDRFAYSSGSTKFDKKLMGRNYDSKKLTYEGKTKEISSPQVHKNTLSEP